MNNSKDNEAPKVLMSQSHYQNARIRTYTPPVRTIVPTLMNAQVGT